MRRSAAILFVVALAVLGWAAPSSAAPIPTDEVASVDLVPATGTQLVIADRRYAGSVRIRAAGDGLVVTERVTLDQYLAGIREVPFSWPSEALQAQVIAARTYLAYQLLGGRSRSEAEYGYDICATSACQVYAGAGIAEAEAGERWLAAVAATEREILLAGGRPAEAVYSASAGSRTRANQDVWGGRAISYLQPVDSPEEGVSPFETWTVEVPPDIFVEILRRDGHDVSGSLEGILVRDPGEGKGRVSIWVDTEGGTVSLLQTEMRGAMNREGADVAPGLLPARVDGRRLPQSLPSYTYEVVLDAAPSRIPESLARLLPADDRPPPAVVVFEGEGWGHGVGLSQWGAKAMADEGATAQEILGHYYSGLVPVDGGAFVPDHVVVGLDVGEDRVLVEADGPFEVLFNGVPVGIVPGGVWAFGIGGDAVVIDAPLEAQAALRELLEGRIWAL